MSTSTHEQRGISHSQFGDYAVIHQGNVQGNVYYNIPHPPARPEVVRVIPYPRNEDLVRRGDLIDKLDQLLPQTQGYHSAALWGLGGSGKTQIALDYAYRRCDADDKCCIFWVHADNQASFVTDYKTIGKKLQINKRLDGSDLLDAVRDEIEALSKWVMIFDNADDLRLFGVGQQAKGDGTNENLYKYVPRASQGTVLWTSRDARIVGTLVGSPRGIAVRYMALDEAESLFAIARGEPRTSAEVGVHALLEELQYLPLALSQAGLYMRRMSMSAEQYLGILRQGRTRWQALKISDTDRHRRPEVSNSMLETLRISIERIRTESEMSYRMLHVVAYVDNQDIPHELMVATVNQLNNQDKNLNRQATDLEILEDVARLKELSFLSLRQGEGGVRSYEMHKLVQEAVRYGLEITSPHGTSQGHAPGAESEPKRVETSYASIALQVVDSLFPIATLDSCTRCEQYMTHAIRVAEWAEVAGTEIETATLLGKVSNFLIIQGRCREREPVNLRELSLRRQILGEKHPTVIECIENLAGTYYEQGRYNEAESLLQEALDLWRQIPEIKHRDITTNMQTLAAIHLQQGRYNIAQGVYEEIVDIRLREFGEKDRDTLRGMSDLAKTYHKQGQYDKAEKLVDKCLRLQREVMGEKHPDTLWTMRELTSIYGDQGRYDEAENLGDKSLRCQQEVFGERHPDTLHCMSELVLVCRTQGRYDKAEKLADKCLRLQREVLGEEHSDTIWTMRELAAIYYYQGRYDEAEQFFRTTLDLRRHVLGENHPDTIESRAELASLQKELQPLQEELQPLQEELQQVPSPVEPDQSSVVPLWKGMRRKASDFRKAMFSRKQTP